MITRYSDHAANERTFLAWVRTAITLMAFGFVIERFDLFLRYAAPPLAAQQKIAPHGGAFANATGLAFIVDRQLLLAVWTGDVSIAELSRAAAALFSEPSPSPAPAYTREALGRPTLLVVKLPIG